MKARTVGEERAHSCRSGLGDVLAVVEHEQRLGAAELVDHLVEWCDSCASHADGASDGMGQPLGVGRRQVYPPDAFEGDEGVRLPASAATLVLPTPPRPVSVTRPPPPSAASTARRSAVCKRPPSRIGQPAHLCRERVPASEQPYASDDLGDRAPADGDQLGRAGKERPKAVSTNENASVGGGNSPRRAAAR